MWSLGDAEEGGDREREEGGVLETACSSFLAKKGTLHGYESWGYIIFRFVQILVHSVAGRGKQSARLTCVLLH